MVKKKKTNLVDEKESEAIPEVKIDSGGAEWRNLKIDIPVTKPEYLTPYNLNFSRISPDDIIFVQKQVGSTSDEMGGTINLLSNAYNQLTSFVEKDRVSKDSLEKRLAPIEGQLKTAIKQYEDQKKVIVKIGTLLEDNSSFLISSIESQGKIHVIESEIASISKRLEKIEANKNINWNKATTIIAIVVASLSFIVACISVGVSTVIYFIK